MDVVFPEPVVFAWPRPSDKLLLTMLSSLVLRKSTSCERTLERILACTPFLKHLTYDHRRMAGCARPHWECLPHRCPQQLYPVNGNSYCYDCRWHLTEEFNVIYCDRIDKALRHVQSSLVSLELKVAFEEDQGINIRDPLYSEMSQGVRCMIHGRLTSLRDMHKLRFPDIPWMFLFGWEADMLESNAYLCDLDAKLQLKDGSFDLTEYQWQDCLPASLDRLGLRDDMADFRYYQYSDRALCTCWEGVGESSHGLSKTGRPGLFLHLAKALQECWVAYLTRRGASGAVPEKRYRVLERVNRARLDIDIIYMVSEMRMVSSTCFYQS